MPCQLSTETGSFGLSVLPGCSPPNIISRGVPEDRALLLGNMFLGPRKMDRYRGAVGSHEVALLRTPSHCTMSCTGVHQAMALFFVVDPVIGQFPTFALAVGKLSAKPACCLGHRMN